MVSELQLQQLLEQKIEKLSEKEFYVFLLEKWRISSGEYKGERFGLKDTPYLVDVVKDDFPYRVLKKSAQSRISEVEVARAIFKIINKKRNGLYTFPAGEQMEQFVDARVRSAIIQNPFLASKVTGSLNLKKISLANRELYFRGVQKRRQIITIDASDWTGDEIDEYDDEGAVYTLTKRLFASKNPTISLFSTPTFHGVGISLLYYGSESQRERGSDQRVWTIKCEHCGKFNEDLIWEENIRDLNEGDIKFSFYKPNVITICRKCKEPIDRLSTNGKWVAKFKDNSDYCHGYSISKLFNVNADLNTMMLDSKDPLKEQEFNNSDLGRPYEPKGSRLTDDVISNARGNHSIVLSLQKVRSFSGFDIGAKIHAITSVVENDINVVKNIQELDGWDDVPYYLKNMSTYISIFDANPDTKEASEIQKEFENVWLAYFIQNMEGKTEKFNLNYDDGYIYINRTLMMATVSDLIYAKNIQFPRDIRKVRDFYEQLKSPIKATKQDVHGNYVTFYPKTKIPDHYYFALLYNVVATQMKTSVAKLVYAKTIGRL
jgi:hypothetical protein